ncbi:ATP-binding cassette sub-family F member 3 [Stegastes partitus]|uniref:ATP-binding cassette sub-family F member 3 n=1 Tax=Stegastes partitus TaxID=144197 RepID=A0A9Y4TTU2_9TELE|nr:PREDICTED: ATP-binding cassette sub-family F member 3 [Stegastes partitus]
MATYVDILKSEFPEIDSELFDYITGVLDSGADFEDGEEVYDAIGGVLQDVSADSKNEDDIRDICLQMFNTLKLNHHHGSQKQMIVTDPCVSSSSVCAAKDVQGIWMMKRPQNTTVDAKKLEKAEAKLKAKHERRNEKDSQKASSPLVLEEASASQASSKKDNRVDQSGKNRSYDIRIENFDVSFGERCLLQGAELSLASGRRYGLIGRNGLGKTTLLKMLASRNLRVPGHISILHVEQEVAGDDTAALQSVLQSDTQREELLHEEKTLNARIANGTADGMESVRLSEIYVKLEEIEADKAPARASVILAGLGFSPKMQQQTTKEFSGGWRMRLALARALFARQYIQVFIDRFRYNANRAAQVQSKLKLLERLPELKPIEKETEVTLRFPDNFEKLSPPILQLDEVEFYYSPDQRLFSGLNLSADLESRICIVGENGAGKTTVLKLLMGELTPVGGVRQAHRNLKIGYFSQHHVDQLDLNVCSVELLLNKFPGRTEEEYRHQLGGYGITGELATRPVASLSGGQKSRVAFAQMTMPCPNFYILDEPTNHLDMETIEALAKALNKFRGGVILVSHDERLIRLVCKELWVCENGKVGRIDGGFDEYRDILHEQFRKEGYL